MLVYKQTHWFFFNIKILHSKNLQIIFARAHRLFGDISSPIVAFSSPKNILNEGFLCVYWHLGSLLFKKEVSTFPVQTAHSVEVFSFSVIRPNNFPLFQKKECLGEQGEKLSMVMNASKTCLRLHKSFSHFKECSLYSLIGFINMIKIL